MHVLAVAAHERRCNSAVQQHSNIGRQQQQQPRAAAAAGSTVLMVFVQSMVLGQVGQVATSDGSMETWTIGRKKMPASLPRSGLTSMEAQIIGNLFENLTHLPVLSACKCIHTSCMRTTIHSTGGDEAFICGRAFRVFVRCVQVEGHGLEGQVRQRARSLWLGYQEHG